MGFNIKRSNYTTYKACSMAKVKEENVPKETLNFPIKKSTGRVYIDIACLRMKYQVDPT